MANGLKKINKMENMKKIPGNLSIYLLAGTKDPVSNFTKDMLKVYEDYKKAGIKDLSLKFYEGSRHEILNELNRQEVYNDIINWINDRI
jgi:alpha-beta hydrolase superfamily lysophospholipase